MAAFEQIREGEIRPDQLEIGKVYRIEQYGRSRHAGPHKLIDKSLGRFKKRWGGAGIFIEFTIVAPGTSALRLGQNIDITSTTSPRDNFHYRFFETAQDRIVPQFEQRALQQVFDKRIGLDKATAWGLTDGWFAPSKKSGGRKYKTRQTKLRRKNRTRKNRTRTHPRR
jgi:hypothetical protein